MKIDELLESGAAIDYQSAYSGNTALIIAVNRQNERIVEYLLRMGANPFVKNKRGKTAKDIAPRPSEMLQIIKGYELLYATEHDDIEKVISLIKADHSILNFKGKNGYSALFIAAAFGNIDTFEALLRLGADPDLFSEAGETLLEITHMDIQEEVRFMLQAIEENEEDAEMLPVGKATPPRGRSQSSNSVRFFDSGVSVIPDANNKISLLSSSSGAAI
ncbi:ankyrin repeat domain-containing protein [Legionella sp. 16cNR16C]|uniref:ankyrin repeat domain-containing protein n=1 Tax=Legionella sp. 16cNR16C TaxID=2905656 RepID=UPI001E2C49DE|nr:ankyrin repeat domain-containing protein [Legionella sp. 16cNR16C]MCE3044187.1 ankyrin repeat domain-containing protein [Legionella sp. 16cNR16C]